MDYIRIDPLIDNRPKMVRAGWWACRVFELLLKVSGKYDLRGVFSENYLNPDWLAREWNYQNEDVAGEITAGQSVLVGLDRLFEVGILERRPDGSAYLPGWEEFYGKKDHSTNRVRAYRERAREGKPAETGETGETPHTPPTHAPTDLMALWNKMADPSLPRCLKIAGDRERMAEARLKEKPLEYWAMVIGRISASDFCKGKNNQQWKASFDWLVHPLTHAKVMEGKYDNRTNNQQPAQKLVKPGDKLYGAGED